MSLSTCSSEVFWTRGRFLSASTIFIVDIADEELTHRGT
jgi:hypothetical protein